MEPGAPGAPPPPVELSLDFYGVGCVDIELRVAAEPILLSGICYGTDAIGDLVRFALTIATGGRSAECSFDLEPHELRLSAKRVLHDPEVVEVAVHELADFGAPISAGFLRGSARCAADDLAAAVARATQSILETQGREGHREAWGWEFPSRATAALNAALEQALPPFAWGPSFPNDEMVARFHILSSGPDRGGRGGGSDG